MQRTYSPPPKFSWGSSPLVGILEERALEEALEERVSWRCSGGADTRRRSGERTLGGALVERAQGRSGGSGSEGASGGAALGGALEARALGGALAARDS